MNLPLAYGRQAAHAVSQTRLITLGVDTRAWEDAGVVRWLLLSVRGVEDASPDPTGARVWVFANGPIVPEALVEALESWGYGGYVLDNRFMASQ